MIAGFLLSILVACIAVLMQQWRLQSVIYLKGNRWDVMSTGRL